ncbi:MAG: substrate-binding domain-containing protein [Acidobacteriota bacterium]|nr:substrate-binding domain-containing protein [Acidobacteriota bacterium]
MSSSLQKAAHPHYHRRRAIALAAALAAAALSLTACGSSGKSASSATSAGATTATTAPAGSAAAGSGATNDTGLSTTLAQALGTSSVPASSIPPIMSEALTIAGRSLTPAQLSKALSCWKATSCTLGSGNVTVAEADGFGGNTWRSFSKMNIILQALTYPQIGKFIYTNANGSLSTYESNIRELTAEGVKAIVAYNDFGPAAWPAFEAAQRSGAVVSTFVGPSDGAPTSAITTRVQPDICQVGKDMAAVTQKVIGGNGPVAYFTGTPANPEDTGWQKCATDAGIQSVFNGTTNWTPSGAQQAASALIASGKTVKAILYSYSNPVPNIVQAYQTAGKPIPAIIDWTTNNSTVCLLQQNHFTMYLTNALNWAARVSLTALMDKIQGKSVPAAIYYPMPFFQASASQCTTGAPADYPGPSALVPSSLVTQMLGS